MARRVRCSSCREYVDKEEALVLPLGHVCNEECLAALRARRTKKRRNADPNSIPVELRKTVHQRDGNACRFCRGITGLQCHHVIYRSQGGQHEETNLILLCEEHHRLVHSNKKRWQPILLGVLAEQYGNERFYMVAEYERLLASQG